MLSLQLFYWHTNQRHSSHNTSKFDQTNFHNSQNWPCTCTLFPTDKLFLKSLRSCSLACSAPSSSCCGWSASGLCADKIIAVKASLSLKMSSSLKTFGKNRTFSVWWMAYSHKPFLLIKSLIAGTHPPGWYLSWKCNGLCGNRWFVNGPQSICMSPPPPPEQQQYCTRRSVTSECEPSWRLQRNRCLPLSIYALGL